MNSKTSHPEWALKHRRPGTELRKIRGRYYLYEYKTVYDKQKKRPKKISGKILGSITEQDGFKPSAKRLLEKGITAKEVKAVHCKEYGMAWLVMTQFREYYDSLCKVFGQPDASLLMAIAYCRFVYKCPLKRIPFRLAASFLPELLSLGPFNEKKASGVLNRIGRMRGKMQAYMKSFIREGDYILMDVTNIFCRSEQISLARKGYNNALEFDNQFNLLYIYSADSRMPVYFRLLPGNIREVKAFKNSLLEAGLQKAIIVADKGFYSQANVELLQEEQLDFILPLKRNNKLVSYRDIAGNNFKDEGNYFEYHGRIIWYKCYKTAEGLNLCLFLDEQLKVKEEKDYLRRITTHPEAYNLEQFHEKKNGQGTIALLTPMNSGAEDVYLTYKGRMAIEVMFDGMKNVLEADHTYMQNEQTLHGWMFVNHITLQWYQHLYIQLKEKNLLKKISVSDYVELLTDIKKVNINNTWYINEYTNQTRKMMEKLGLTLI